MLSLLMKCFRKLNSFLLKKRFTNPICEIDRTLANELIYELLNSEKPCMISRFGTTELITINNYLCITQKDSILKKLKKFIADKTHLPWWDEKNFKYLDEYSGVFPPTKEMAIRLSKRYLKDIPEIDILGSFQYYEKFMPLSEDVQNVHLETLYPFFVNNPWTRVLKGKKVLVIHPFEDTIKKQYSIREKLFNNSNVLPEFELITLKSVQSAAGIRPNEFNDWHEALVHMKKQIDEIDFDIAIIGCGAYGLPLAAHVKRKGKKAFHIGGGLQLLFGIKGKRWDNPNYGVHEFKEHKFLMAKPYCSLYNKYWTRPLQHDTPKTASKIDEATYW